MGYSWGVTRPHPTPPTDEHDRHPAGPLDHNAPAAHGAEPAEVGGHRAAVPTTAGARAVAAPSPPNYRPPTDDRRRATIARDNSTELIKTQLGDKGQPS